MPIIFKQAELRHDVCLLLLYVPPADYGSVDERTGTTNLLQVETRAHSSKATAIV